MTIDNWITIGVFAASVVANAFLVGRKSGELGSKIEVMKAEINGRFDVLEDENEHCQKDRHGLRNVLQLQAGDIQAHGIKLARLEEASRGRRHRESDDDG